jgi:hypothetical protein
MLIGRLLAITPLESNPVRPGFRIVGEMSARELDPTVLVTINWSARLFPTSTDYGLLLTAGSQQGRGSSRDHPQPQPGEAGTSERAPSFR